jgi:hypothetical protein
MRGNEAVAHRPLQLSNGMTSGIGSLPHRDVDHAARFVLDHLALPAIPSLPRRSPAEGMIAQAVVGIEGITLGQYGAIAVDAAAIDPANPVVTDLQHDAFGGFRAFLAHAPGRVTAVKWQFVGPVTLGMAPCSTSSMPRCRACSRWCSSTSR